MTTLHLRAPSGRPIGDSEIASRQDVDVGVIDGKFEQRWIVDVRSSRSVCRSCERTECEHAEQVERAVRSTIGRD